MSRYQPEWRDGREVGKGRRDAAGRFDAIAAYLGDARDFTALDFGAYGNYFSARLVEQFGAHCTAVDDTTGLTESPGIKVINRRLPMSDLVDLGPFDVALCLSVLHHLPNWPAYLNALETMAPLVFVETSHPSEVLPKAKAHGDAGMIYAAVEKAGGKVLTTTPGYDSRYERPLWVIDRRPAAEEPAVEEAPAEAAADEPEPPKPEPVKRTRRRRAPKPE